MLPDEQTRISDEAGNTPIGARPVERDALVGRVLKESYRIEGKIGEGGMGVVYRATQIALGRPVAVKTIHAGSRIPASGVERFFREARLLSQLNHPNIVHIIDFGSEAGALHFMVMEYLQGESLDAFVGNRPRLAPDLVFALMEQLCAAMTAAHINHVIHRDLKPSNIIIINVTGSPRPVIKVLDFGLGKMLESERETVAAGLTREGVMMGTCGYSAPEQLHGGFVDERADIYGLGAILYFLLSGRPPYLDEGVRTTLVKQLTLAPDPLDAVAPGIPDVRAVEAVIHKAMSVRPADRHPTALVLLDELRQVLCPEGAKPPPQPRLTEAHPANARTLIQQTHASPAKAPSRKRWWVVGGLAALLAAGGVAWLIQTTGVRATAPGVTATEITLGMSGPFSGPTRELGPAIQAGIEACFKRVNQAGGVFGRKLRLKPSDDRYEPELARNNMHRLLQEDKVFAFIGNVGTPTAAETLPIALENKRIFFGACTGASFLRKVPPDRYVFNYRAGYAEETAAIVHYLVRVREIAPEQIAVFAQKDNYGEDGFEGVARAVRQHGKSPDKILRVGYRRNHNDVDEAVAAVVKARSKVRAVVIVATYHPAAVFIHKVKEAGLDLIFANVSFVGSGPLVETLDELGTKSIQGVIVTQVVPHFASSASGVLRYKEDLHKYSPAQPPSFASLEGYIAACILVEGLRNAGKNLTAETLVEGLEKIHDLDLAIGPLITFGPSEHQGSHKVWGAVLDDKGNYHDLEMQ